MCFKTRTEEIGGGSMLTEFGLCYPNISDPLNKNNLECTKVLDLADSYFQSWTYWDFKPFWNTNGDMIKDLVSVFSRPYPIATAGIPKKMNFEVATKEFHYEFIILPIIHSFNNSDPTEIFIPPMTYPNSQFDIEMSDFLTWEFSPNDPDIIFVIQTKESEDIKADIPVYLKLRPVVSVFRSGG